jgi:hypothetical protein
MLHLCAMCKKIKRKHVKNRTMPNPSKIATNNMTI